MVVSGSQVLQEGGVKTTKFLLILLMVSLSGCAKETVSYFTCAWETRTEVPSFLDPKFSSLVVDTRKKTLVFDDLKGGYIEHSPNLLVSKTTSTIELTPNSEVIFDTITGRLRRANEFDGTRIYWCEETEKLFYTKPHMKKSLSLMLLLVSSQVFSETYVCSQKNDSGDLVMAAFKRDGEHFYSYFEGAKLTQFETLESDRMIVLTKLIPRGADTYSLQIWSINKTTNELDGKRLRFNGFPLSGFSEPEESSSYGKCSLIE